MATAPSVVEPIAAEFVATATAAPTATTARLGMFGGVFTPSFLTIIGVIMYLRFSWVVGTAGLIHTIAIVVLANAITFITALAVAGIASNERMETGGAYFMVSRVLGLRAGGGIGLPLYVSQALSIALYVIGFAEAIERWLPGVPVAVVGLVTLVVLSAIAFLGASLMIRVQYVILAAILLSLVSIALGFRPGPTPVLTPAYTDAIGFWGVFAVFFPAVTGILAGVSMSGDLRDPARAIPRGTLLAVGAGFAIYLLVPIMLAWTVPRADLYASTALQASSRWPALVQIGVIGATLSSAIGSLLAAPRTLQALAIDSIAPRLFARGVGARNEPIPALAISIVMAGAAIALGSLNAVAEVLTMFFLTTYGVLNISAAIERILDNPSFRPAVRVPWWISMAGAAGCFGVMFLISPSATIVALVAVVVIVVWLGRRRRVPIGGGGVWEGVWTALFLMLSRRVADTRGGSGKNWRPLVQVFASESEAHADLVQTAAMVTRRGGALAAYAIAEAGTGPAGRERAHNELTGLIGHLRQPYVFGTAVQTTDLAEGVVVAAQAAGFAGGTYNTVMMGLPAHPNRDREQTRMLAGLNAIGRNVLLFKRGARTWTQIVGPITVWWGGQENNVRLMLVLAYLLQQSHERRPPIRLSTIVGSADKVPATEAALRATLADLRLEAETVVVANETGEPVGDVLRRRSGDAAIVLLGMGRAVRADDRTYLSRLRTIAAGLDTVLFVLSNEAAPRYE